MKTERCDDCFDDATYKATSTRHGFVTEYYCDECVDYATAQGYSVTPLSKSKGYMPLLPADGNFTEDDLWEAIAEANGLDASEIMDGDLVEWL